MIIRNPRDEGERVVRNFPPFLVCYFPNAKVKARPIQTAAGEADNFPLHCDVFPDKILRELFLESEMNPKIRPKESGRKKNRGKRGEPHPSPPRKKRGKRKKGEQRGPIIPTHRQGVGVQNTGPENKSNGKKNNRHPPILPHSPSFPSAESLQSPSGDWERQKRQR